MVEENLTLTDWTGEHKTTREKRGRQMAITTTSERRTVTIHAAVEIYSVSASTLYRCMDDGTLPFVKIRNRRLLKVADLDAMIEAGTCGGNADAGAEA